MPGFKAGGPIQSLKNMIEKLSNDFSFKVITSVFDHNSTTPYPGIHPDHWNTIQSGNIQVLCWYGSNKKIGVSAYQRLLAESGCDTIYINGIFSLQYFIMPLIALRKSDKTVVVCPRGMLQQGALQKKSLKKKLYLLALRSTGLLNKVRWHATNEEEARDVQRWFPVNKGVIIASNIPKPPLALVPPSQKREGRLRLVYLSLISEKKNLHLILNILQSLGDKRISLDIYGPLKDPGYWKAKCKPLLDKLRETVTYHGDVAPENVQDVFAAYDYLILPTKGENFGHAIYECLSAGRPVITSQFTPWNNLDKIEAGWNVDINNHDEIARLLKQLVDTSGDSHYRFCRFAHDAATGYYRSVDTNAYKNLFGE